jgi:hypothetical protein
MKKAPYSTTDYQAILPNVYKPSSNILLSPTPSDYALFCKLRNDVARNLSLFGYNLEPMSRLRMSEATPLTSFSLLHGLRRDNLALIKMTFLLPH